MKKKYKVSIIAALTGLSLSLGAVSFARSNKVVKTDAASGDKFMFIQITDEDDIEIDDIVIFAADSYAINRLGGNPCYTYGQDVANHTDDYSKFNVESTSAAMFKVETGYQGNISSYSFKCLRTAAEETSSWLKTAGKYLSYADKITIDGHDYGYHEDGITIQTKGDIIFKSAKDEYSSWNADFDSDGYVHLSRANETNRYGQEGITDPIGVKWTSGYIKDGYFGYFFGDSNLRMYRKVNVRESNLDLYISKGPDKLTYNSGEYTDLTGLELTIETKDTYMTFKATYEGEPALFDALPVVYDSSNSKAPFKWMGIEFYVTATVYPDRQDENNYLNVSSPYKDLRGTYVLASPYDGVTSILDLSQLTGEGEDHSGNNGKVVDITGEPNPICDSTYDGGGNRSVISEIDDNVVTIVKESDGYYVKIGSDYLAFEMTSYHYGYVYRGLKANSLPIKVDYNNDIVFSVPNEGNKTLTCDKNLKKFYLSEVTSNERQVELYRLVLKSEHYSEMDTFRSSFFSKTATCDATGESNNLVLSNWQSLASEFTALSLDSQAYIASLTYSHNGEEANSLKDMVDRYDMIVSKYSNDGFTDFMSRGDAGTLQANYSLTDIVVIKVKNDALIIITVISVILMSAAAAVLVLKKKRITIK